MKSVYRLVAIWIIFLPAVGWSTSLQYSLHLRVHPTEGKITAKAQLSAAADTAFHLSFPALQNIQIDGKDFDTATGKAVSLNVGPRRSISISYELQVTGSDVNLIKEDNVFLLKHWYPVPNVLAVYDFQATLPKTFTAVSTADSISIDQNDSVKTFRFQFKHPLDRLYLAASTDYVVQTAHYRDIDIETYFFREDADLAASYIDHARHYLEMYSSMLTPYPYRRFAIVECHSPIGNAMPTFTLLGKDVVKLPFIVKTSLGHEILHQWFGGSVYIDFPRGNWSEGLTSYLADHWFAASKNEGVNYRKQIMINYHAYVTPENTIPIRAFHQRHNRAEAAVGYGKAAMLFHELRDRFGPDPFFKGLKQFSERNIFRRASWQDLQRAFEKATGTGLDHFFDQRLNRPGIPHLTVEKAGLTVEDGKLHLKFDLIQKGGPFFLRVPVSIASPDGKRRRYLEIKGSREKIVWPLDEPPTDVVIDDQYALMRRLTQVEIPPVLAEILGREALEVVARPHRRNIYQPIVQALGVEQIVETTPDALTLSGIKGATLMIAGFDNPAAAMLFGQPAVPEEDVRLRVYRNPYDPDKRILLVHVRDRKAALAVSKKIRHYGKYSELAFQNGENTLKTVDPAKNGIPVLNRPPTVATDPARLETLNDIFPKLLNSRVIFVGEKHDSFAHHINQLWVIQKLQKQNIKIGIGMEMFPKSSQKSMDDYLAGHIDERQFLEASRYFENWGYDYNLYKPIIDYAKQKHIPIIALNIDGEIIRQVARQGMDHLSIQDKKRLPASLDLSDDPYRQDLREVFTRHETLDELKDFSLFYQAQILWDETMAETAHHFLKRFPDHKLVVLAGNGHIRKKYGIPERLNRRRKVDHTVLVQDEKIETGIADYVLQTQRIKGKSSPRLGVLLTEKAGELRVRRVMADSPAQKAGLRQEDRIQWIADQPVRLLADLKRTLFFLKEGDRVKIRIKRNGDILDLEMVLSRTQQH